MIDDPSLAAPSALTAIVVIPDTYQTIARTMDALKQQTAARRMDIVAIVPTGTSVTIPPEVAAHFQSVQVYDIPHLLLGSALAEGVRRARSPIVAFTEDHAFPAPNWAERLIAAHEGPFAAVGPAMRNANPSSVVSRADFYTGYGKWAEPVESGIVDFLMGHNGSYKRDVLLYYEARLDDMLQSETAMQFDMARRGHTFWLEGATYTAHMCFAQWRPWLTCMLLHGRLFASHRSETWSPGKRLFYAITAPLIPFVRLTRIRRQVGRAKMTFGAQLKLFAVIMVGLVAEAAGQGMGYVTDAGNSASSTLSYEFHRERYIDAIPTAQAE